MVFCPKRKIAFFLVPRTGSDCLRITLHDYGFLSVYEHHVTYEKALRKWPVLNTYKCYGYFRHPEQRFFSALRQLWAHEKSYDEIFKRTVPFKDRILKYFYRPQTDFLVLPHVEVLDFDKYEEEFYRVIGNELGVTELIRTHNEDKSFLVPPSDELIAFAKETYAGDFEFGKKVLGKVY
jgi:hypothetical protein